ncbi:ClpP/crotonase-like domain-containing protein [Hygrophoropsis aurantiaca]|uniref:ClpP/crotonase-like domain-containing protein n=1 Tax=Hygrophoropsis aurantiaca TaxID=72124 RepID=A0ACB8A1C0_9AGAM|nr:ClpP/crotonase-like domain-containing protein [Hygrophoropsis aurantiaca]
MSSYPLSLPASKPLLTVTNPKPDLWILELHNGDDSRLTDTLINGAFRPALDFVEEHWAKNWHNARQTKDKAGCRGALIIVGNRGQNKFFSNGFDWESIKGDRDFFSNTANPLLARLLTFPIPVIAAVNGHAFAAGMILALACDYRVMTDGSARRAWMCMNEVNFGAPWPLSFTALLEAKVSSPTLRRRIALEGYRMTATEALDAEIIDRLAPGVDGTKGVLEVAEKLAEEVAGLPKEGVCGSIKTYLYRDCLDKVGLDARKNSLPLPPAGIGAKSKL